MQRVYLLLRNNKQTGPHSFDELVQMGLKNSDLVWIEGKSFGWSYPSEIEALKPYIPESEITAGENTHQELIERQTEIGSEFPEHKINLPSEIAARKNIHVSLPAKSLQVQKEDNIQETLEKKAEELRKRAQAYSPTPASLADSFMETKYNRSLDEVEENFTSWVYQQKTSKTKIASTKKLVGALSAFALVAIVFFSVKFFFTPGDKKNEVAASSHHERSEEIKPAKVQNLDSQTTPVNTPEQASNKSQDAPEAIARVAAPPVSATAVKVKKSLSASGVVSQEKVSPPIEDKVEIQSPENKKEDAVATPVKKDKKTFGEKIDGLFDKLKTKKAGNKVDETVKSLPNTDSERSAEHREEASTEAVVDLSEFTELTSNLKSSSWMMGIKGLKITLKNKSSQSIQRASAEVRYFNEQNEILDKKTIQFTHIAPKKSIAVSAPDNRLADHIEFHLISATGKEDGYANH